MTFDRPASWPRAEAIARLLREVMAPLTVACGFPEAWPQIKATRPILQRTLPVVPCLERLCTRTTPAMAPLVQAIADAAGDLEWRQTYSAEDFGPEFLLGYGWTELIGLRGPIASETMLCGLLLLGPDTHYPSHAHEAEELYVPLAGAALWQRGDEGFVARAVGAPILHVPWMPHAMRTGAEAVLAAYVWRGGDLAAKATALHMLEHEPNHE